MTVRTWARRTVTAGVLAAALTTPLAGIATAAPNPAPAPSNPVAAANKTACDAYVRNRTPRANASIAAARYTQNPRWEWAGAAPLINNEINAIRTEVGTLNGTIAKAAPKPALANALRAYQARLNEYSAALRADLNARGAGKTTWARANPAGQRMLNASNAVVRVCNGR